MATDAKETAKQENGSRVYFEAVIEKGITDEKKLKAIVEKVYPKVPEEWMNSFKKQVTALKSYLGRSKGYKYSRDDGIDRKSTRLNSSHSQQSRMPSSA